LKPFPDSPEKSVTVTRQKNAVECTQIRESDRQKPACEMLFQIAIQQTSELIPIILYFAIRLSDKPMHTPPLANRPKFTALKRW